ncbi:MAG: DUF748 domain-containing protein, partial [Candidatus Binataceae bacterium]
MADSVNAMAEKLAGHLNSALERANKFGRSRGARRIGIGLAIAIIIYGIGGYFGVPYAVHHVVTAKAAAALDRPVAVGEVSFNPYTLRLDINNLEVGARDGSKTPLIELDHLRVKVSWTSIFRFAPIVKELEIDQPAIHIVRIAKTSFNFSDLLESPAKPQPKAASAAPAKPLRFAVSNIQISGGTIIFDDKVLNQRHSIEQLQLGIPFIANLPADTDIFVQPFLRMLVDGTPFSVTGKTKPFGSTLESVLDLKIDKLDIPRYLEYAPKLPPVKIPSGTFSAVLKLHFVTEASAPQFSITGIAAIQDLDVRDSSGAPLLAFKAAVATLKNVQPLAGIFEIGPSGIEGLAAHLAVNADGTTNLGRLFEPGGAAPVSASDPPAAAANAPQAVAGKPAGSSPEFSVASFELDGGSVDLTDNALPTPGHIAVEAMHAKLANLSNRASAPPATIDFGANLHDGGTLGLKGTLDIVKSETALNLAIDQVALTPLTPFVKSALDADIASGKFSSHAALHVNFGPGKFNVHAQPADFSVDGFNLRDGWDKESPVQWTHVGATISSFDLASREAVVGDFHGDAIHILATRGGRKAEFNLMRLIRRPAESKPAADGHRERHRGERKLARRAPAHPAAQNSPAQRPWQFRVEKAAIEKAEIHVEDTTTRKPVRIAIVPLNFHLTEFTSDFKKPFTVELDAAVERGGSLKIAGTAAIDPLKANLHCTIRRLDLAAADPFLAARTNAGIASAGLTMDGDAAIRKVRKKIIAAYKGDLSLTRVRIFDRVMSQDFLRWGAFDAKRIDFEYGNGKPRVHIGSLALEKFAARVILDSKGRLTLKDLTGNPNRTAISVRAPQLAAPAAPAAKAAPTQPIAADIEIGGIALRGGRVNYTDNFIKPNYSANLTGIAGTIGAFGTASEHPSDVALQAEVNGSAPLVITGAINPLAPAAYVQIKAKADGVELTGLTPYSAKYTGYPIVKGTLTVEVSYLLDQGKLTADNHIVINQLTFGDRVESKDATNLPIRLAVALLKNSQGVIDLDVPISGSLSDPQFSLSGVILHTFMN